MKVLFATGEAFPFVKTGGLGDVSYSLPKTLVKRKRLMLELFYLSIVRFQVTY